MHVAFASIWCLAFALIGIHTTLVTELLELVLGTDRGYNQLSCLQRDDWKKIRKRKRKRYTSGPRYRNVLVLVKTGTFLVNQYCLKIYILSSVIQKYTILECKNGLVLSNTSELSICTMHDFRTVGMPISFMYACVKFVIRGPPNSTTLKGPDNHCGEDASFDILPSQKSFIMQIKSSLLILQIQPQILADVVHASIYIGYLFNPKFIHRFQI